MGLEIEQEEMQNDLCVRSSDGMEVWLPVAAIGASPVLQTLASEDLSQGGGTSATAVSLSFAACTGFSLQCLGRALAAGGLPLSLRWEVGDRHGLAHAVDVLRCAQFLDMPLLVDAACCELAAIVAHTCPDAASISAALDASAATKGDANDQEKEAGCGRSDEEEWMRLAPSLGDRGRCLVQAWLCHHSAMAGLPSECFKEVLRAADQMVRSDAGVYELLEYMPDIAGEGSPASARTSAANAVISHAVDVLHARASRYRHSELITSALAAHAVYEHGSPELRVRTVKTLKEIAMHADAVAVRALLQVLKASQYAGGLLLEGSGTQGTASSPSAAGTQKSPVADAARRMGLDASWQVRVEACRALEVLAGIGKKDVISSLVEAIDHGYFEVRQAAAHALGQLALPGDELCAAALIRTLGDDDWRVRDAAGEGLASLAAHARTTRGKQDAAAALIPCVCERLVDKNSDVRRAVRQAIRLLSMQGSAVIEMVPVISQALLSPAPGRRVPLARRPSPEVRAAVIGVIGDTLAGLKVSNDMLLSSLAEMLAELGRALTDRHSVVRQAALAATRVDTFQDALKRRIVEVAFSAVVADAVGSSAEEALEVMWMHSQLGDQAAVRAARHVLEAPGATTAARSLGGLRAAVKLLAAKSAPGDPDAVRSLVDIVHVSDIQTEVFKALETVSLSDSFEMRELTTLAADEALSTSLRRSALHSLGVLAHRGNQEVLHLATEILESKSADSDLRGEALGVVVLTAEPGDAAAKALVAARLSDSDAGVRRRALEACEHMAEASDPEVVKAIVEHAVTGEFNVRSMALRTLQSIASGGDPLVVSSLLPWLEHGHWPQRQAALEALAALAAPGDDEVLSRVMRRLTDCDETCRQTACEVLAALANPGDEAAAAALAARLDDGSWIVRDAAALALEQVARA